MKKTLFIVTFIFSLFSSLCAQNPDRPNSYNYNRALECLQEEDYVNAYTYLMSEINDNPQNGYAYFWLSCILAANELYGDGLAMANEAEKYLPANDKDYAAMTYNLKGDIYSDLEEYDTALSNYSKALKTDPKNENALKSRATLYYQLEEYDLSDKDLDKLIEIQPMDYYGYMGKGRNANEQKKYEEAIKLFDYVVKLHGNQYFKCYSFRAESYIGMKQYDKAADDIITAMQNSSDDLAFDLMTVVMSEKAPSTMISKLKIQQIKEPEVPNWPYYIGIIYEAMKNYDKAIEYYNKSNSIDITDVASHRISNCYYQMGDYQQAMKYNDEAIAMDPEDIQYRLYKSDLEYETGLVDEAIKSIETCIERIPEYFYFYYRKGFYEDNALYVDDAIEGYSTAILLNPDYFYSYLGRADMYMKKGMRQEAMDDYKKVVEKDTVPSEGSCAQYAFLALGERDKAIKYNQRVLDSLPDDPGAYYDAACLYSRMGEPQQALGYLKTAFEKGFRRFEHIEHDDDLESVRQMQEYQELIAQYQSMTLSKVESSDKNHVHTSSEIPFTKSGGVTEVQCSVNGLPLHFVFDTGASVVTMSMLEASFMLKNKYLTPMDIIGRQNYLTADGNITEGTVINLKSVKIGELELSNVRATVVKSQNAPLLLGQSVLGRLGKIEIDNARRVIKVIR